MIEEVLKNIRESEDDLWKEYEKLDKEAEALESKAKLIRNKMAIIGDMLEYCQGKFEWEL